MEFGRRQLRRRLQRVPDLIKHGDIGVGHLSELARSLLRRLLGLGILHGGIDGLIEGTQTTLTLRCSGQTGSVALLRLRRLAVEVGSVQCIHVLISLICVLELLSQELLSLRCLACLLRLRLCLGLRDLLLLLLGRLLLLLYPLLLLRELLLLNEVLHCRSQST